MIYRIVALLLPLAVFIYMKDALKSKWCFSSKFRPTNIYVQLVVQFRICFMLFHRYRPNFIKKIIKHDF
jgi:hypothetical protein